MFLVDLFGNLIPPALLMFFGYSFTLMFRNRMGHCSLFDNYFVAVLAATGLLIIPTVLWIAVIDSSLVQFFMVYTVIAGCICAYSLVKNMSALKNDYQRIASTARCMINGDVIERLALISLIVFVAKAIFYLSVVPINVDALYFHLPSALYFVKFGHVYPYADPPVAPLLYAWTYSVTNGVTIEPFRQIPLLYILCGPLLALGIARRFLSRRFSLIAMVLFAFSPFLDVGLYLWPWHADFIAGAFAGLALFFTLKPIKYQAILIGLSLSLSLLTKAPFGLAATLIVVIFLLRDLKKRLFALIPFLSILLFLLVFGLIYSFSLVSSMSPIYLAVLASLVVVLALAISFYKSEKTSHTINPWILLLALSPVMIWVVRQVALGGTPLSIPIFPNQMPATAWWNSFTQKLSPPSGLSSSTDSILMIFYHPLLGLIVLPMLIVGLAYSLKKRRENVLFLIIFAYYFIWLSAFSNGASFRHLYPILFFLFPVVAIGFFQITRFFNIESSSRVFLMVFLFAFLESTLGFGVYLANWSYLPEGLPKWILSQLASQPPWLYYENIGEVQPFVLVIVLGAFVSLVLPLLLSKRTQERFPHHASVPSRINNRLKINLDSSGHPHIEKLAAVICLALCCSFLMIAPLLYSVSVSTGGDFSQFSVTESWYRSQIEICDDLKGIVRTGRILTFGFDAFYYLAVNNLSYYDLLHGHITSFPLVGIDDYVYLREAVESSDVVTIESALSHFNIRYVLLPTSRAFAYPAYERFNEISHMFTILNENGSMRLIKSYDEFDLYDLDFNRTSTR